METGKLSLDITALSDIIVSADHPVPSVDGDYRLASVFMLLKEPEVDPRLLTVLKTDSRGYAWRNQMAFPGGHVDETDASPLAAAYRELEEELAIPADDVHFLGSLGQYVTIQNRMIEAFLGVWSPRHPIRFDASEIAKVYEVPLAGLVASHVNNGYSGHVPGWETLRYPHEDVVIWGVTARVVHHFIETVYHP
ncbi:MAG: coenzyme A pyrophosphatase [Deltaproteobacteria bacterium]|nr:MAG: coenzyme A pyrophosphatase [Deltaproteobacteria bacterium]